jgi:predicted Zn-dependent protease
VPLLAAAVEAEPNNARVRHLYATALFQSGSQAESIEHYEVAHQLSPRTLDYQADLARALLALGRLEEALPRYEESVALAPRDPVLMREMAQVLTQLGQVERATALLRRATEGTGNVTAQRQLAQNLDRSGDLAGAEEAYRGVLAAVPGEHYSRGLLAEVLYKQGRSDEAIEVMREGIALAPGAAMLHRTLGSLLERSGSPREAAAAYREYARLAPLETDAAQLEQRAAALEAQ